MNLEAMNPERLESLHTIGEVKDPPGTSFYTPTYPPTHRVRRVDKGEDTVTEDQYHQDKTRNIFLHPANPPYTKDERREDKGDNIATDDEYEDKTGMSFDSNIIWLFTKSNWSITY